ncbi:DUF3857 domain-containing protein [Sphingobacterium griseoflavum]|uniref:DUF3857 domain-containing protein n=1 Tax=Sphingobacterium griseoflavum TaxID=1474952 RepID=A0ABQ3HUZ6_9SPHI|nr:DUF3857 domain-containing protein [Sphingobacterium griseoflavum]GHE30218.1 hypothetical protein GCM10017764_11410 [Sphingobacterium griseoflavum]
MKLRTFLSILLLMLLAQVATFAAAPTLTTGMVPSWTRTSQQKPSAPNLADISDGYYFERIEYQVDIATQTRFYRNIKVLTENAGASNAGQIQLSFNPQYQKLVLHELHVLRDGKRMERLDLRKFELIPLETELSRSIYNGSYAAYLLLEDLRKDDKIICSYSIKGFNPVFAGHFFDTFFLQGFEPVGQLLVNYIVPKDRNLQFKSFLGAPEAKKENIGSALAYYWDITDCEKVDYEPDAPLWHASRQRIECSEFKKWADIGQWAHDVNPIPALQPSGKLRLFADQMWTKAKGDSMRYAQHIADFVQNDIRYMGVEVGEYSHRANSPEKVFAQRYGDCKDKSVLLAALLKHKGIFSKLILVNSMEEYSLEDYLPAPTAFNHMVLYFSIDGRGQYIDPTITDQGGPFRDRYFPFYGKVLAAEPNAKIADTYKIVAGNTRIEERFFLSKDGTAKVDVLTVYKGCNADNMRSYFKQNAKNQVEKSYLTYYQKLYKHAKKRASLTYEDDIANNVLSVKEYYTVDKLAERDLSDPRQAVSIYALNLSGSLPQVLETRVAPIALPYPLSLEHDIYIINPDGKEVPFTGENSFVDRESYYFGKSIKTDRDTLKVSFRLGFHDTHVPANQLADYVTDFGRKDQYFSAAIFLDDDGFVTGSNTQDVTNWWSVLAFFGLLSLFTWITFRYYNRTQASSLIWIYDHASHENIGGWLIFLGLGLFFTPIRVFLMAMLPYGFSAQVWSATETFQGPLAAFYLPFIAFEFVTNTVIIFLSGYCLYLFLKKRDLFPQTVFLMFIFQLVTVILDTAVASLLFSGQPDFESDPSEMIRSVLFAIIWILYVLKSTRVKGTFVRKYGEDAMPAVTHWQESNPDWQESTSKAESEKSKADSEI